MVFPTCSGSTADGSASLSLTEAKGSTTSSVTSPFFLYLIRYQALLQWTRVLPVVCHLELVLRVVCLHHPIHYVELSQPPTSDNRYSMFQSRITSWRLTAACHLLSALFGQILYFRMLLTFNSVTRKHIHKLSVCHDLDRLRFLPFKKLAKLSSIKYSCGTCLCLDFRTLFMWFLAPCAPNWLIALRTNLWPRLFRSTKE